MHTRNDACGCKYKALIEIFCLVMLIFQVASEYHKQSHAHDNIGMS